MNIYEILKNATPNELREIREFLNTLDSKPIQEYVVFFNPKEAQRETGELGANDIPKCEKRILSGWRSTMEFTSSDSYIYEKRLYKSRWSHYQGVDVVGQRFCGLKFVHEFKKFKRSFFKSSKFHFF